LVTYSSNIFHAVSDETRRAILDRLRSGALPVQEIADAFPVSRPAISKHLRVLHKAGLVNEHRIGRNRVYRLNSEPLRDVDQWVGQYREFWASSFENLKRHAEPINSANGEKKR
jgi:DNA-binding transcriptional ArsR family regulator